MGIEDDTRKIQRKVYLSFFQDGLWDMVLGLFLLGWGVTVLLDLPWLPGAVFVGFFWLAVGLKQKITYPRTGYARPAGQRRRMTKLVIAGCVVLLLGIMAFLLVVTNGMPQFLHDYFELLFGAMLAAAVALIGYWWGIARWYVFAALMALCAVFNQWLGLSFPLSFIIPGGLIFLYGLVTLVRFLNRYPKVPEGGFDGSR